jgi:hypothetical protein
MLDRYHHHRNCYHSGPQVRVSTRADNEEKLFSECRRLRAYEGTQVLCIVNSIKLTHGAAGRLRKVHTCGHVAVKNRARAECRGLKA